MASSIASSQSSYLPLLPERGVVGTFSSGIANSKHLLSFLNAASIRLNPSDEEADAITYVVGWGRKPNTARAQLYATKHGLPYILLEDALIRSVGLGVQGSPAYGLVVDDLGIYYDSTRPSRLEAILEQETPALRDVSFLKRARSCIDRCTSAHVSKYNFHSLSAPKLPSAHGQKRVLIADQTAGDLSLRYGSLAAGGLQHLVRSARSENPDAQLLVKSHPDTLAGKKRSALLEAAAQVDALIIDRPCDPHALLEAVDHVYVATSQLGFEALLYGKEVTCFGMPFYAGWGLTDDRVTNARRSTRRSLDEVFAAAYLLYGRYLNPETGEPGELEDVIEHMERQRAMYQNNHARYVCVGFSSWKHPFVRAYLRSPDGHVSFYKKLTTRRQRKLHADDHIVAWGQRGGTQWNAISKAGNLATYQMEDGFLRSPGLGSDLTVPASLVLDGQGIYYDPTRPSDLETILEHEEFDLQELNRAAALRGAIVNTGVSKYNVGHASLTIDARPKQCVVLVPGQVESDASIVLGCRDIKDNLSLLAAVRNARPEAYLIYKPHPDVLSGNRRGRLHEHKARTLCDRIVTDVHIRACLEVAHEVHTMTSLVGFEALLRGISVFVHGQPFYGGWGLTHDRYAYPRRTRKLTLDMLVAGTLLRYPRYVHPETLEFITPEGVISYLQRASRQGTSPRRSLAIRQLVRLSRAVQGVLHAR